MYPKDKDKLKTSIVWQMIFTLVIFIYPIIMYTLTNFQQSLLESIFDGLVVSVIPTFVMVGLLIPKVNYYKKLTRE
jgi:hypothetical protein